LALTAGLAVGGGGLLAGCGSATKSSSTPAATSTGSFKTTSLTYQLSWIPDAEFAGSFAAKANGYYAGQGLNVSFLPGGPNVAVEPVVTQGKALIGSSNADITAAAVAAGAPLKIFGARYQINPFCIISGASKPISEPGQLYGKKVGVSPSNQTAWVTFVKLNKLDASKIDVIPVSFDPTPLAAGQVDAWLGFATNEPIQLELKGFKTHVMLRNHSGRSTTCAGW